MTWIRAPVFVKWTSPVVGSIFNCSVWLVDNMVENATVFVWGFFFVWFWQNIVLSPFTKSNSTLCFTQCTILNLCMCVCMCSPVCQHMSMYTWKPETDFRCLIPQVSTFSFGCHFETGSFTDHGASLLRLTGFCVSTYSVLAQQTHAAMCSFSPLWCGQTSVPFDYMRTALQTEPSPLYFVLCSRLGAFRTLALASASPCSVYSA